MKLYLVRHGETNYNLKGLTNDDPRINVFLTEKGKKQAREVGKKLKSKKITKVISSEFLRAKETAKLILQDRQIPITLDSRANEFQTGNEGKPVKEFRKKIEKDPLRTKLKGGESFLDLRKRAISLIEDLKKESKKDSVILIVTHSAIMKAINAYLENLSDEEMLKTRFPNCTLKEYEL